MPRSRYTTAIARVLLLCSVIAAGSLLPATTLAADSPWIYGIHWWGYTQGQPLDNGPCQLLDCNTHGGWSLEIALTSDQNGGWSANFFAPLVRELYNNKKTSVIMRLDYTWGQTVPYNRPSWPNEVVDNVNKLKDGCHIYVIGNEPNIVGEGVGWPDSEVTPEGYAAIYRNVRNAVHNNAQASPAGEHIVLIAPPSPGGVINGVRWMSGNEWLGRVLDAIPANEIDGIAIHAYGHVGVFHSSYVEQLDLINSKGLYDKPIYITESNVRGPESMKAQFARDAFTDLGAWNAVAGNHNIICCCWFVYDGNQQGGGWGELSIEHAWNSNDGIWDTEPYPSSKDLYRAFEETVDLRIPAGAIGTPEMGTLNVIPTSFDALTFQGEQSPGNEVFYVRNLETTTLNYTIDTDVSWLYVNPAFGASNGETDTITMSFSTASLHAGQYTGRATVTARGAPNSPQTVTVNLNVLPSPFAPADFDRDFDVDQSDFGHMQACFSGTGIPQEDPDCQDANLDTESGVDAGDLAIFLACMTGADVHADPLCGQ